MKDQNFLHIALIYIAVINVVTFSCMVLTSGRQILYEQ